LGGVGEHEGYACLTTSQTMNPTPMNSTKVQTLGAMVVHTVHKEGSSDSRSIYMTHMKNVHW